MEARAPVSLTALAGLPEELDHAPGSEAWRDSSRALHQRLRGSMADTLSYL